MRRHLAVCCLTCGVIACCGGVAELVPSDGVRLSEERLARISAGEIKYLCTEVSRCDACGIDQKDRYTQCEWPSGGWQVLGTCTKPVDSMLSCDQWSLDCPDCVICTGSDCKSGCEAEKKTIKYEACKNKGPGF